MRTFETLSYHEAGHACALAAHEFPFEHARVWRGDGEVQGVVKWRREPRIDSGSDAYAIWICCLAGPIAETRYSSGRLPIEIDLYGMDSYWGKRIASERATIERRFASQPLVDLESNLRGWVFGYTCEWVDKNWKFVSAVADELRGRGELSEADVLQIAADRGFCTWRQGDAAVEYSMQEANSR